MATDGPRRAGRASDRIAADLEQSGERIERLRMTVAVIAVLAVLLVAAVLWLGRAVTVDPTRRAVDELTVPGWAAASVHDETYGSRWCLGECRVRMRTWTSEGTVDDTANEYWQAALNAGWTPADPELCVGGFGEEGCYVRDELYLELWVVPVDCGDRYELCVGSEVTAVVAAQAALPRLAEERASPTDLRPARVAVACTGRALICESANAAGPGEARASGVCCYCWLKSNSPSLALARNATHTRIRLLGVGAVRVHRHRPVEGRIKTIAVKREGCAWYVVLSCEVEPGDAAPKTGAVTGIEWSSRETRPEPRDSGCCVGPVHRDSDRQGSMGRARSDQGEPCAHFPDLSGLREHRCLQSRWGTFQLHRLRACRSCRPRRCREHRHQGRAGP